MGPELMGFEPKKGGYKPENMGFDSTNAAQKLPDQEDKKKKLIELRKKQIDGNFTKEDGKLLMQLSQEEEAESMVPLTEEEEGEYLTLTRMQTESKDWSAEKAARMAELEKRKKLVR